MIGRQVCFEAGAGSTQGRLKVDPRPTKSRFKVAPRPAKHRPKVEPIANARSNQGQPNISPRSTLNLACPIVQSWLIQHKLIVLQELYSVGKKAKSIFGFRRCERRVAGACTWGLGQNKPLWLFFIIFFLLRLRVLYTSSRRGER